MMPTCDLFVPHQLGYITQKMMPLSALGLLFSTLLQITSECTDIKKVQAVMAARGTQARLSCPINTSGQIGNIMWAKLEGGLKSTTFNSSNTSLTIQTVNSSDSGWYRCKHSLGQSQRCFDIHLHVQVKNVAMAATTGTDPGVATQPVQVVITSENVWEQMKRTLIIVVAAIIIALIVGFIVCHKYGVHRICARNQSQPEIFAQPDVFEIVDIATLEGNTDQQIDGLYRDFQNETMCSFKYE